MADTVRALTSFALPGRFIVREGDVFPAGHQAVQGREHLFESATKAAERAVETATAAPGEKRTLTCPEDGCDYEGGAAGLKIHTARAH